ncbi:MAG: acetyltransferase [Winogradskyella sp.]|uniref:acetyltransferase n=1 Tax=Winogradskyella sp. TaxID=1883156 RepID=UPI00183A1919|nr:acetyltransferase [Winogradskyella sp.]
MKNIVIYGASGHGKMIVDIILKNKNYNIKGFIDSFKPVDTAIYGQKVIGNLDALADLIKSHNIYGIVIAIGENHTRQIAYNKIKKVAPNINFIPVVHPEAILAHDIVVAKGTVIMAGAIVNSNAEIGEFCILNTKSSLGHDSKLDNFSSLASGATLGGNVTIGSCTAVCLGATLIQNITIGNNTVIGAGSLVLKDVGDLKTAFGVPVNVIKDRKQDTKYLGK